MFKTVLGVFVATMMGLAGCSAMPKDTTERDVLKQEAQRVLKQATERQPEVVKAYLDHAAGYAVIPTLGEGGFVLAGGYGKGVVYEKGAMIGYCDATQMTVGAQIGGQRFSEIIFFETPQVLNEFKQGHFAFRAQVQAVALSDSAARRATYRDGIAVLIADETGLMAQAAAGGQKFRFVPGE